MLTEIRIESLGAISSAVGEFDRGLTVLTGETGTGKTMVVTGLHLLGGARADATRVRSGPSGRSSKGGSAQRISTRPWSCGSTRCSTRRAPNATRTAA
ncbi:AAA domain protein [Mycobacterium intracellulare 1956]|uniref:DNA repair protein RecN n=1 Tax=Mycobacterium intracellulare 1956 TaxID=1299331 RepID=X8CTW6_MYCIT|nr:AAA domain protein [Mycobacterium intracellulare 1956]